MKEKIIILLMMTVLLLSACKQTHDSGAGGLSLEVPFEGLELLEGDHPELDFGLSLHDGQRTIRDFAITGEGNLLLLQLSEKVYEYSPEGELLETYDFKFAQEGLTAYMLTCDDMGNFYFLDGHNCLFIKANRRGLLGVATLGKKSIVAEPALIKRISALREDILLVEALSVEDYISYTYQLDVSGEEALSIKEAQVGVGLGEGLSYQNEIITKNEYGGLTDGTKVTIYENGLERDKIQVHTGNTFLVGLNIYGLVDKDSYFAKISEFLEDGDSFRERFIVFNKEGKIISSWDAQLKEDDIIRVHQDRAYILRFNDGGIIVLPMDQLARTN